MQWLKIHHNTLPNNANFIYSTGMLQLELTSQCKGWEVRQ